MESKDKINNNEDEHNNLKPSDFQDLTPIDDVDLTGYKEALDRAFNDDKIKNIAITGSYGSGKSSILNTYKKDSKLKFIHISFLHFKECDKDDTNICENKEKSNDDKEKNKIYNEKFREEILERKIINHIINQIPFKYIPYTNFNVRGNIGILRALSKAIFNLLSLSSFFYIIISLTKIIIPNSISSNLEINPIFLIVSFIFIIAYLTMFFYKLNNRRVSGSIKFKNLELNMDKSKDSSSKYDSFFDSYLDEILYIFKNCRKDIIVFEDIDRLEMGVIFERLREINILLNERLKKKNKVIKFCYLIRDDIFIFNDRIKMFDFIIPVIPILNSFNSHDILLKYFSKFFDYDYNFYEFTYKISEYITDMRMLNNIYNEFIVYNTKIDKRISNFSYQKLLSIIIYKTFFPKDFNDLNHNKGFLFNILRKSVFKCELEEELKKNIEENEEIYKKNINDILEILKQEKNYTSRYYEIDNFIISLIRKRILDKNLIDFIDGYYKNKIPDDYLNINFFYKEIPNNTVNLKMKILEDLYFIKCINEKQFSDMTYNLAKKIFDYSIKLIDRYECKDLLWYLLYERFIDESCGEYITYFSENYLDLSDKNFIMNVLNDNSFNYNNRLNYDYKLSNPEFIIFKLNSIYYNKKSILNFDLLDKLLNILKIKGIHYNKEIIIKSKYFLYQLAQEQNFDFIKRYFDRNVINSKCEYNKLLAERFGREVKLCNIDDKDLNFNLFNMIIDYDLYELNEINLIAVLNKLCDSKDLTEDNIKHKNYSLICNLKENKEGKKIYTYIHSSYNIYTYLGAYINKLCDGIIKDDEKDVISLIEILFGKKYEKYSIESEGLFIRYIERLVTKIKLISKIDLQYLNNDEKKILLYQELFKYNVVNCFVENIYEYYLNNNKMDEVIIKFINESNEELKFYNRCSDYDIEDVRVFLNELKNDNRINENKRTEIQSCIDELDKF